MSPVEVAPDEGRRAEGRHGTEDIKMPREADGLQTGGSGATALTSAFASMPYDNEDSGGAAEAVEVQAKDAAVADDGAPAPEKANSRGDGTSRTQTSVFADFAEDGGLGNKDAQASCESPTRTPIDLSQAGSMMHRLMEKDKNDVDPRDVHKLLPGQLLSSPSLDLNVDLLQKAIAMAAQTEMHREQCQTSVGRRAAAKRDKQDGIDGGDKDEPLSPASAPSFEAAHLVQNSPRPPSPPRARTRASRRSDRETASPLPQRMVSPIPGWPSPPPHMVPHMSPALGMAPFGGRPVTPPGIYMDQRMSPVPMPMPVSGPYAMMSPPPAVSMAGMPLPWGAYPPPQQYTMPGMLPPPVHAVPIEGMPATARPPKPVRVPRCPPMPISACASPPPVLHGQASMPGELQRATTPLGVRARSATPELGGSSSPMGAKDKSARRFRSMEAALAWCHVQHSQKQVPVVPKEDVKRLVEFQLSSGKPIRAPWYRPQKDDDDDDEQSEQEMVAPRELHQNVIGSVAQPGQVCPTSAKSPKQAMPVAPDPTSDDEHDRAVAQIVVKPPRTVAPLSTTPSCTKPSDDEHDRAVAQIVVKPPRTVAPLRTTPSCTKPSPAARMAAMPPMQQMLSSPPADAPVQSPSPTRMSKTMMKRGPVRMPTSPTRMSQMMTTPSPVRMSAGRMISSPQRRCAPAPPLYRSATSHGDMMGYAHTAKCTGGRPGSGGSMGRAHSGGHGTGFFVPAGMVLPA